jgi:VRR-NUC domain
MLKQSERQFERAVVEYAEFNSWLVYHTYDSRRSKPGFPDLVLVRDDRLLFVELKSERGRLSDAQLDWMGRLERVEAIPSSCVTVFVWRPSDWVWIESVLAR